MENKDKYILKIYISLFGSIIIHSITLLLLFAAFPSFEPERKTIPFQLMSNDRKGHLSNSSQLSKSENSLAAQEFLRTLNESSFEQLIKDNTRTSNENRETISPFKQDYNDNPIFTQPTFHKKSSSENAFQGLQNIFSKKTFIQNTADNIKQISTESLEKLTQYEVQLLQQLAKNKLYDEFHPVMEKNKQTNIEYIITLHLLPNGAIKSANIKKSSNIAEIDQLAIKAAYLASPFSKPPNEDISRNYKYDIPIIYKKTKN